MVWNFNLKYFFLLLSSRLEEMVILHCYNYQVKHVSAMQNGSKRVFQSQGDAVTLLHEYIEHAYLIIIYRFSLEPKHNRKKFT